MGDIVEAIFISSLNNERASCNVQDLRTGTDLMRYKGGGQMQRHTLNMLGEKFVIAANSTKPLLHVWPLNGQEQMSTIRYVVPGNVTALALSPDSAFLIAGIQETIYVWHLNSGRLLNMMAKHFQAITCIRFTDNGEHFATAGKDGAVLVWNLTRAVAPLGNGDSEDNAPFYSFNDHGLAVTDVHIGMGGIRAFMYTVSLDRCCKVYDLSNGSMLLSVVFPVALHSVIVNKLETSVFVGTGEGQVLVYHMNKIPRMKEYHLEENESQAFVGHTAGAAITSLALSVNADQLISGGDDKQVCVWDVASRQLIRSIAQLGSITNLHLRLISSSRFHPAPKAAKFFADSLKRVITPPSDDDYIEVLVTEEYEDRQHLEKRNFDDSYFPTGLETDDDDEEEAAAAAATEEEQDQDQNDDEDEEMAEPEESQDASLLAELASLRAENARLKREAKALVNMKVEQIAGQVSSKKKNKNRNRKK
ncbi:WD repeat-containing protein 18 [Drosophila albomicans]|uniref:WD repeat-containing protein 18 n=1 Tax=Drosophila albomicans TaxID=7291 RepID=A0A6P8WPQ6_DROAB|nr:WD repeat-containing protein 18 [Drosophila albomicans]